MKKTNLALILSCLTIGMTPVFAAYTDTSTTQPTSDTNKMGTMNQTQQMSTDEKQRNGEVIAWLIVLNNNEIAAANAALRKKLSPEVKEYVRGMLKEHVQNLQQTNRLSQKAHLRAAMTDKVKEMKEQGRKDMETLKPLKDRDFQTSFIDMTVKNQNDAIQMIDSYLSQATDPTLQAQLKTTRDRIQMQMDKAKEVQAKLSAQPGYQPTSQQPTSQPTTTY